MEQNVGLCIFLIEAFTCQEMIKEFLVDCTVPDMSRFTAGLIGTAMQMVYKFEEQQIVSYLDNTNDFEQWIHQTQGSHILNERIRDS